MENTKLQNSKKYKTVGDLLKAPIKSIILVSVKEPDTTVRDYLYEWLFTNHYSKKLMLGNLTARIRNINNTPCYNHIVKNCFSGIEPPKTSQSILNTESVLFIQNLHTVESSMAGCFLDYLLRRIICFHRKIPFEDSRASELAKNTEFIYPMYASDEEPTEEKTQLPKNMLECYNCVQNLKLKTENILSEIFIVSLCHSMAFGGFPKQEKVDKMICLLQTNDEINSVFYVPIENLCLELIQEKQPVLLNPCCGRPIKNLDNKMMGADCDLIVDDVLYDIKCTSGENYIYKMLQLMGYASLINCNPTFGLFEGIKNGVKINKISVINLFKGEITGYDISHITEEQMLRYLEILMPTENDIIQEQSYVKGVCLNP